MRTAAIRERPKAAIAAVAAVMVCTDPRASGLPTATQQPAVSERSVGNSLQTDAHEPRPWFPLTVAQQAQFDLGYRVFNTEWVPANSPPGRIDGLGPVFNVHSCDGCHNSRRRGRGPRDAGEAPADLVLQLGKVAGPDRTIVRGSVAYGFVLNTAAVPAFKPEGRVTIEYDSRRWTLADGSVVELRDPSYHVDNLSGPALPPDTVLMPRIPPLAQGSGLLEQVPRSELEQLERAERETTSDIRGRMSLLSGGDMRIGRLGWQASEPTVASQIGVAFAREMGLTNPLMPEPDCGEADRACRTAPTGGSPEVAPDLFEAVVAFERWHAVPIVKMPESAFGAQLFQSTGCADCHRLSLRIELDPGTPARIHPYTDLLLHTLGEGLADRDLKGAATVEQWRTAPLWGMHAARSSGQPLRLLHDGRARSIEEAILWHDAEGRRARDSYSRLPRAQRAALLQWVENL